MFVMVTGGSGSGKSAYAEERILRFEDVRRYYIATMQCHDPETEARIARHRQMRAGKGFVTIERDLDLKGLLLPEEYGEDGPLQECIAPEGRAEKKNRSVCSGVSVLLECMSNLAANEMFDPRGAGEGAYRQIQLGIDSLLKQCDNLVVVTNEIFSDGETYSEETLAYQKLLGEINRYMAARADEVVDVVCSIPITLYKRE